MAKRIVDFDSAIAENGDYLLLWDTSENATKRSDFEDFANSVAAESLVEEGLELLPVINRQNTPGTEVLGNRYLIGTAPVGWGPANNIAEWDGSEWVYTAPVDGNVVYATIPLQTLRFSGSQWKTMAGIAVRQNGQSTSAAGLRIGTENNAPLLFETNGIDRVRLENDGSMGYIDDYSAFYGPLSIPHVGWIEDYVAANGGLGAGQGLTQNGGVMDLGGTITENKNIILDGVAQFQLTFSDLNQEQVGLYIETGGTGAGSRGIYMESYSAAQDKYSDIDLRDGSASIYSDNQILLSGGSGTLNMLPDSTYIDHGGSANRLTFSNSGIEASADEIIFNVGVNSAFYLQPDFASIYCSDGTFASYAEFEANGIIVNAVNGYLDLRGLDLRLSGNFMQDGAPANAATKQLRALVAGVEYAIALSPV